MINMNIPNLTPEQEILVKNLFSAIKEAQMNGVGFVFDSTNYKLNAFNATGIKSIEIEEVSNNCNLNADNMACCDVEFMAHYYSDGSFLVAE